MNLPRRPHANEPSRLKRRDHARLWALVEGAVTDACLAHEDYLTERGRENIVRSITKRVVGQIVGGVFKTPLEGLVRLGPVAGSRLSSAPGGQGGRSNPLAGDGAVQAPVITPPRLLTGAGINPEVKV